MNTLVLHRARVFLFVVQEWGSVWEKEPLNTFAEGLLYEKIF